MDEDAHALAHLTAHELALDWRWLDDQVDRADHEAQLAVELAARVVVTAHDQQRAEAEALYLKRRGYRVRKRASRATMDRRNAKARARRAGVV